VLFGKAGKYELKSYLKTEAIRELTSSANAFEKKEFTTICDDSTVNKDANAAVWVASITDGQGGRVLLDHRICRYGGDANVKPECPFACCDFGADPFCNTCREGCYE